MIREKDGKLGKGAQCEIHRNYGDTEEQGLEFEHSKLSLHLLPVRFCVTFGTVASVSSHNSAVPGLLLWQ